MQNPKEMWRTAPEKLRIPAGVLLTVMLAFLLARIFAGHHLKVFLPLWFVAVLVVLGARYGMAVGVAGSLLAAAIFATTLFSPIGSLAVSDHAARQNLAWMVLGGVTLSYLFGPSNSAHKKS